MMNKSISIQELEMSNEINLCDSCCHEMPTCEGSHLIFGDGKGDDNVCACNAYEPVALKEPPPQSLAEIQAQAIEDVYKKLVEELITGKSLKLVIFDEAKRIRKQAND